MKREKRESRWSTIVEFPKYNFKIDYSSKIMCLGSCFANEIGAYLSKMRFDTQINPTGALFNPYSISKIIELLSIGYKFESSDLLYDQELYFSFYHSSHYSDYSKEAFLAKNNKIFESASKHFIDSNILILTFGTSWIYRYIQSDTIVANCHKMSSSSFKRESMEVDDIVSIYSRIAQNYPNKKIIISVSPIRHLKDGAIENSLSKSKLILAANILAANFANVNYLPIYELFMDELRDYRFYAMDMVHPSEIAVNYVCDIFKEILIDSDCHNKMGVINKIVQLKGHKPFFTNTENYKKLLAKIEELEKLV